MALINNYGVRDEDAFQNGLVLDMGVSFLTECYREPFLRLLDNANLFLQEEISVILKETLGMYPKFESLVREITIKEIEMGKAEAAAHLNIIVDCHKRIVNCNHPEFMMMKQLSKKPHSKNLFDLWFKEQIPTASENNRDDDEGRGDSEVSQDSDEGNVVDDVIDTALDVAAAAVPGAGLVSKGIQKVRGVFGRLQKTTKEKFKDVSYNILPSKNEDKADMHIDFCLEYMEIIDKTLVDEVPKIIKLMLARKLLDILRGEDPERSSFLFMVQGQIRDKKGDIMVKSEDHERMIAELERKREVAENTIKVIDETKVKLRNLEKNNNNIN